MIEQTKAQMGFEKLLEASNAALDPLLEITLQKQMPASFTLAWRLGQVEGLCLVLHLLDDAAFESHFDRLVNTDTSGPLWPYDMGSFLNVFIQDAPASIALAAALQAIFNDHFNGLTLEQKRRWMDEYDTLIQAIRGKFAEAGTFVPKPTMGAWGFD